MKKQSMSFLLSAFLALPGLTVASASIASAQEAPTAQSEHCSHGRGGRHGIEGRMARLTERLGLDANQQALVREAFERARAERESLRANAASGDRRSRERREAHRALMQRTMERIDAVLTPEQRATFEQMRARMREHHGRRGRGHRGGDRGAVAPGAVDPRGI